MKPILSSAAPKFVYMTTASTTIYDQFDIMPIYNVVTNPTA